MNAAELTNQGLDLYYSGLPHEAAPLFIEAYNKSTSAEQATAAANASLAYARSGHFDESFLYAQKAYQIDPDNMNAKLVYGEALFREGRWLEAWQYWIPVTYKDFIPLSNEAEEWNGQSLEGKEVLVTPAGGYGDVFMLSRYIPELERFGCKVSFAAATDMIPVFLKQPSMNNVNMTEKRNWDIWMHLFHFPKLFQMTPQTILWNGPYIESLPTRESEPPFRLGIKLGAGETGDKFRFRSVPGNVGEKFLEHLQMMNCEIVPLTMGSGLTKNWLDTIALISSCDLILSVDTSVLHLAGAMGKPVWAILGDFNDPKWLRDRSDTPWYPSMKLFRGNGKGFSHTLSQVTQALYKEIMNA